MSQKYSLIKLSYLDPLVLTPDRRMAHLAIQQGRDTSKISTSPNQTVGLIVGRIEMWLIKNNYNSLDSYDASTDKKLK